MPTSETMLANLIPMWIACCRKSKHESYAKDWLTVLPVEVGAQEHSVAKVEAQAEAAIDIPVDIPVERLSDKALARLALRGGRVRRCAG